MNTNNRNFKILTLSKYQSLGDPVTILTGSVALLSQLFPGIFGGGRRALTESDWQQLIPGNGYYTSQFRDYMKRRINYDVDFSTWNKTFTMDYLWERRNQICPNIPESCWSFTPANVPGGGFECSACFTEFVNLLSQEKFSGGKSPVGNLPGTQAGFDWQSITPWLIGGIGVAILLSNKKGKRK